MIETPEERELTLILAKEASVDELREVIDSLRRRGKAVDLERAAIYEDAIDRRMS